MAQLATRVSARIGTRSPAVPAAPAAAAGPSSTHNSSDYGFPPVPSPKKDFPPREQPLLFLCRACLVPVIWPVVPDVRRCFVSVMSASTQPRSHYTPDALSSTTRQIEPRQAPSAARKRPNVLTCGCWARPGASQHVRLCASFVCAFRLGWRRRALRADQTSPNSYNRQSAIDIPDNLSPRGAG